MIAIENYFRKPQIIDEKRKEIISRVVKSLPNFNDKVIKMISNNDLQYIFNQYDELFFDGFFKNKFNGKVKCSLSKRMTRSAGITQCPKNISKLNPSEITIEIKLSVDFIRNFNLTNRKKEVCGLTVNNQLEGILVVFEHEICHVAEFIKYYDSSCKKERFKIIANGFFGHENSYHQLPTYQELAYTNKRLSIGQRVIFSFENEKLEGFVSRITKRATVMVKSNYGNYVDGKGIRYSKYYVPTEMLTPLK